MFGDGSVTIISTPGHTPGHQSLLVHLPKTGWLILSGDAVHFKDNWDNKRVASMNTSADQTQASFKKIEALMAEQEGRSCGSTTTSRRARRRNARRSSTTDVERGPPGRSNLSS